MSDPIWKHPIIDAKLTELTGVDRPSMIKANKCVICLGDAITFDEEINEREYTISGMCQQCQDAMFTFDEEEDEDES